VGKSSRNNRDGCDEFRAFEVGHTRERNIGTVWTIAFFKLEIIYGFL
jgi:hypothetical protein